MSTSATPRTWSATITIYATELGMTFNRDGETVAADLSENDLKRDMTANATLEAVKYLLAGMGKGASVQLYKTTKAGTRPDAYVRLDVRDAAEYAMKCVARASR